MSNKKAPDPALSVPANFHEEDELATLKDSDDVQKLRSLLEPDEIVYRIVLCFHEDSDGVLAATNKRIIFADKKFITSKVVVYEYAEIAAIVYANYLLTSDITLVHKNGSLTLNKVDKTHGSRFLKFVGSLIGNDYENVGDSKRVFRHVGDILELKDLPSQQEDQQ